VSSLILGPNDSPIQRPKDPYWDGPITRYEVQKAVNALALNDNELTNRSDTVFIVVNLLCEKAGITPGEVQAYVDKKSAEVLALREKIAVEAKAKESQDAV
jgi:hypothetical protein